LIVSKSSLKRAISSSFKLHLRTNLPEFLDESQQSAIEKLWLITNLKIDGKLDERGLLLIQASFKNEIFIPEPNLKDESTIC